MKIHRTPTGPAKDALTVIVTANFSGKSTDNRGMPDTRSLAMILVTLRGAKHTITASDTVRLTHRNNSGQPVRFDIRIPRSAARALAGNRSVNVRATVTREFPTIHARARHSDHYEAMTDSWRCSVAQAEGFTGSYSSRVPIFNTPPPAPPAGFEQWIGGTADSLWSGANEALICVSFGGSGYGSPN